MTRRTKARQRWSVKKKAQVLTVGTMIFLVVVILLLPHAFAYEDPAHCYGYSDCYGIGQTRGQSNAYSDYWNHGTYDKSCPTDQPHSQAYCNGYSYGYWNEMRYLAWNHPRDQQEADKLQQLKQQQSIGQSSDVSIKGNNNRVVVNQGVSDNNANNGRGGSDGGSSDNGGSRIEPSCKIICSIIKIGGS